MKLFSSTNSSVTISEKGFKHILNKIIENRIVINLKAREKRSDNRCFTDYIIVSDNEIDLDANDLKIYKRHHSSFSNTNQSQQQDEDITLYPRQDEIEVIFDFCDEEDSVDEDASSLCPY